MQIRFGRDPSRRGPARPHARQWQIHDVLGRADDQYRHVGQPDRLDARSERAGRPEGRGLPAYRLLRQRPDRVRTSGHPD